MGIYIKGMEMPGCCTECFLCRREENFTSDGMWYHIYNCCLKPDEIEDGWIRFREADTERQSWCPIVEVKTPHGRLKDVDTFHISWYVHRSEEETEAKTTYYASKETIDDAPTIIGAEE